MLAIVTEPLFVFCWFWWSLPLCFWSKSNLLLPSRQLLFSLKQKNSGKIVSSRWRITLWLNRHLTDFSYITSLFSCLYWGPEMSCSFFKAKFFYIASFACHRWRGRVSWWLRTQTPPRWPEMGFWLCHLLAVWPQMSYLNSVCLT